jgi:predicted nucleic acid-binding protein
MDVVPDVAAKAAEIRAKYNLLAPDAIQVATALFMGATALLANDRVFNKVPEIRTLILDEL